MTPNVELSSGHPRRYTAVEEMPPLDMPPLFDSHAGMLLFRRVRHYERHLYHSLTDAERALFR